MKEKLLNYLSFENKKQFITRLVIIGATLFIFIAFFLPFASAVSDWKETLQEYGKRVVDKESGFTGNALIHITLLEFMKIHIYDHLYDGYGLIIALVIIVAILTLLITLLSALKKETPVIILSVVNLLVLWLLKFDFSDRGLIGYNYNLGISYYFYLIFSLVLIAGIITLKVFKKIEKK